VDRRVIRLGRRLVLGLAAMLLTCAAAPPNGRCGVACDARIWVAAIIDAAPEPWRPDGHMRRRAVEIRLRIEHVLKGPAVGTAPVATRVVQYEPAGPRRFSVPGVWSGLTPDTHTRWVLFLRGTSGAGPRDIAENETRLVLPADAAAADATFVIDASARHLSLQDVVERASREPLNFGRILGEDLLVRAESALPGDPAGFAAAARLMERPGLPHAFRWQVYGGLVGLLARRDPTPPEFRATLALTGFRLLSAPDATAMHSALIQTWLPAVLGRTGSLPPLPPGIVFAAARQDRERAMAALDHDGSADLRAWLDGRR